MTTNRTEFGTIHKKARGGRRNQHRPMPKRSKPSTQVPATKIECPDCDDSSGFIGSVTCPTCHGTGDVRECELAAS